VHHGSPPEKVYPGPVNALARSYKWLLEALGLRIDPLATAPSLPALHRPPFRSPGSPLLLRNGGGC